MCGIAGLMTPGGPPDETVLDKLADALAHRGPDGRGRHVQGNVGLVQNRLSIIDLEGGRQPILDGQGNAIVANGEVYNYLELKSDMAGQAFATGSDCEPPLHLYRHQGPAFARSLRGMYALAIHDGKAEKLILCRDPFGIKPLYLAEGSPGLAFASEPQALLAAGLVKPELDPVALAELLQLQFTTGTRTIFKGIRRLAPGETVVAEEGCVAESRRLPALPAGGPNEGGLDQLLDQLDDTLTESVELHQRSDVPYGMFLSGGIDSSVVLALMARLNPRGILAFTAGFPGTKVHDEREHARDLARAVGARHVEVEFTQSDFWALLPQVAAAMDDPAADYACLPTFKLAQEARKEVKVILSGEGGDELFGGYGRYRHAMRPWPLTKSMRRKGTFDGLDVLRDGILSHWRHGMKLAERVEAMPGRTRLQVAQAVDCADWLPNDLLAKADRCLMANGIEGRVPFLDPVVAAFAFRLPDHLKVRKGLGKWILRRWLETALPASRPFEKKRGFTVPVAEWIAARPEIGHLVAHQPGIEEICHPGKVKRLFKDCTKDTGFACWTLLFYALWHQRHVLGKIPDGDAFSALAERI
ncbi:Asparagine synthetase glutamine-hydrolyzing [Paramagnetospirillum magnetotacticum MS-1]|uniref:asparagine synthase (glutamine-hydrolyzing) n=1 Tax=Paramagnetospirillum magnetotacticum MS-1 TaxID=272627 RepID=A0A0C2YXK0_PARME|nr:asparagine synthase (glutamine-hydrolyzing) [Paramagnetospirillum magnetotacticum]KIL99838.1 Asparagine synthetase glutamine-hydrolyzing [Paramagnetospirillum magnetotacticum MS-1]